MQLTAPASASQRRRYYPGDERVPRLAQLPDSRLVAIAELYTEAELKTSRAYNEALRRGGYQHGLDVSGGCSIVWTLADGVEGDGWSSARMAMIERLLPHIRQFVEVRGAMAGARGLGPFPPGGVRKPALRCRHGLCSGIRRGVGAGGRSDRGVDA